MVLFHSSVPAHAVYWLCGGIINGRWKGHVRKRAKVIVLSAAGSCALVCGRECAIDSVGQNMGELCMMRAHIHMQEYSVSQTHNRTAKYTARESERKRKRKR